MSSTNLLTAPTCPSVERQKLDLVLARRLAIKCETVAASAKSWAAILSGRLQNPKPITPAAKDVATSICREIAEAADELRSTAGTLQATLNN